jgi:hypothetical protein
LDFAECWIKIWLVADRKLEDILIIWDNIIATIRDGEKTFKTHLSCLVIAHVQQFGLRMNEQSMIEVIEQKSPWNLKEILSSIEKLMNWFPWMWTITRRIKFLFGWLGDIENMTRSWFTSNDFHNWSDNMNGVRLSRMRIGSGIWN